MPDISRIGTQDINEPSIGEKLLFICFGPCLGSDDDGSRETGYKGCLASRVSQPWVSQQALSDAMYLGRMYLLKPVRAGQATVDCCFW